jgi:hypothetical protein
MTQPGEPKPKGAGAAVLGQADAPGPTNANRGWNILMRTMGRTMPSRLTATGRASQALLDLTKGKGLA